jgi:hypothetical protein
MMLEHVGEEPPSRLLGCGTFLSGDEVCHLAKSIHHHHYRIKPLDGGKLTMKSMETLSHGPSGMGNDRNNLACFLLTIRFCWQVKQVITYSSASFFKLGQ